MLEFEELSFKQAVTYCTNNVTTIPLRDQGAIYIGGINGAGKSLPFNVLYNVLFGHTPLSSKGKRKLIANPGYYAHVKFRLDNVLYEIRQFFDNSDFEYEGYDILKEGSSLKISGGIPEAEKFIARLLPFTPEEFSSFYYLAQDSLHVLAYGKGSERLDYLSKVFGFDIYDQIRAKLKIKLDEVDSQLADIAKAQANADQFEQHLKKYPSLELLEKRVEICSFHLEEAKKQKDTLRVLKSSIENKISIRKARKNIEESVQKYGELRVLTDISADIDKWQTKQSDYQVYLNQCQRKQKLLQEFSSIQEYVNQDISKLNSQLSTLIEQTGKATIVNRQLKQKRELVTKIDLLTLDLKHKSEEISQLAKESSKNLIEKRALLAQKKDSIEDFKDLSRDGQVCTRCGQILNREHLEEELRKLSSEVVSLNLLIKSLEENDSAFQREVKILEEIRKHRSILDSIQCTSDSEIDIKQLDVRIKELGELLSNAKEAQRLKKELLSYSKYDESKIKTITEQLPKLQVKLKKLQEEFGRSREKDSLLKQLAKLPMIDEEEIREDRLADIDEKLDMYDEVIPLLASDVREFTTIQSTVKDYKEQIESELKKASRLTELATFRKIVNTCYKAYLPANLKKIQVSKISELIAQKLNVFVPLIFNEDISFTVDANENSVDILFKRGLQPERDVRFLNGGFKKRFLIALIPTLAGLISARKRTNLIILDEIEANVDSLGREAIGEFLIPFLKTKFKTVIVISPSNMSGNGNLEASIPLDHFDHVWIASYVDDVSSLNIGK